PNCKGLGTLREVDINKIIPDPSLSINQGALAPHGDNIQKSKWIYKQLELLAQRFSFKLSDPFKDIPEEAKDAILNGIHEKFEHKSQNLGITRTHQIDFEGLIPFIKNTYDENSSTKLKRWAKDFMNKVKCPECNGGRVKKESLYFKIAEKNIAELSAMDIGDLKEWMDALPEQLNEAQKKIALEI